jgi:hypothetical protein
LPAKADADIAINPALNAKPIRLEVFAIVLDIVFAFVRIGFEAIEPRSTEAAAEPIRSRRNYPNPTRQSARLVPWPSWPPTERRLEGRRERWRGEVSRLKIAAEALLPKRPSQIDLVGAGEGASAGTHSAADGCALERRTDQCAADEANACPDPSAAERTIARAVATGAERKERYAADED